MPATINASSSSGIVTTADNSAQLELQTASTTRLTIASSGNVGIGTTSPSTPLVVVGETRLTRSTSTAQYISSVVDGSSNKFLSVSISGNPKSFVLEADTNSSELIMRTIAAQPLVFSTSNIERMRIDSSGNVGIGVTSTSSRLEVYGSVVNTMSNAGTEDAATVTITNADVSGLGRIAKTLYQVGNLSIASVAGIYTTFNAGSDIGGALAFSTQSTAAGGVLERMRINKDGNVGIGTTSPAYKLDILGATVGGTSGNQSLVQKLQYFDGGNQNHLEITGTRTSAGVDFTTVGTRIQQRVDATWMGYLQFNGTGNVGGISFGTGTTTTSATSIAERMRIDSTGNVIVGTTSSFQSLITSAANNATGSNLYDAANLNSGNNTTKFARYSFSGVDTVGTRKATAYIDCGPAEANYVGSYLAFSTRASDAVAERMRIHASGGVSINNTTDPGAGNLTVTGKISDSKGDVRAAPIQSKTSAYVLVATDAGQTISITTGGVTVNASIFSAGDMVSIFNNSGSSQTITQGASVTLRLSGTATTGNRTLAQFGVATLLCVVGGATPTFACTGAGLT